MTDSKLAKQTSLPRKQLFREPTTKPIPLVGNGTLATQKPKKRKAKK